MAETIEGITDIIESAADQNAEESGDFGDFMASIEQNMLHLIKETAQAPSTAWEHWQAFSSAVDWSETWIRCLLSFHLVLFTLVLLTRKSEIAQVALFMVVCGLTFLSERLNSYCSDHWTEFSKQNYFDRHGVFASIMYSGPLLVIGLIQLVNFLALSSSALIQAKRLQLAHKLKAKKAGEEEAAGEGSAGSSGSNSGSGNVSPAASADAKHSNTKGDKKRK